MAQQKERTINLDEMSRNIGKGIETVDDRRADALERLQIVRRVKDSSMQREQQRLTVKYGESHPRVQALANRISINQGLLCNLTAEAARARTPIPVVEEDHWILHGYVRDEDCQGVPGLTVALYDQSNEWVRELGYSCTDEKGYFKIDSASSRAKGVQVSVNVLDSDEEILYADRKNLLTPAPGQVDYREILLTETTTVCKPPTGRKEPTGSPDSWVLRGRVTDQSGRGVGGLIVTVFDKDLVFDDQLGQTETDAQGTYSLTYRTTDYRDLIEQKPDIYLKVIDQKGKTLHSTKDAVRYEAGRVEVVNMEISKPKRKR